MSRERIIQYLVEVWIYPKDEAEAWVDFWWPFLNTFYDSSKSPNYNVEQVLEFTDGLSPMI